MFKNGLLPHTYFTNLSAYFGSFLVVIPNIQIAACKNKKKIKKNCVSSPLHSAKIIKHTFQIQQHEWI